MNEFLLVSELTIGLLLCAASLQGAAPPPQSGVWYVHERTVARGGENLSFSRDLVRNGIDYEWTDPQELPDVIDRARTVMVSPYVYNKDAMPMLEKWKALGDGRPVTLIGINFSSKKRNIDEPLVVAM